MRYDPLDEIIMVTFFFFFVHLGRLLLTSNHGFGSMFMDRPVVCIMLGRGTLSRLRRVTLFVLESLRGEPIVLHWNEPEVCVCDLQHSSHSRSTAKVGDRMIRNGPK